MKLPNNILEFKTFLRLTIAYAAAASIVVTPAASLSVPFNGVVSDGSASISNVATGVVVNQSSDKAIIDWSGFDVGSGETAKFNVPNGNSFTLNRISSEAPSQIYGKVSSNGQLMMINRNGMVFNKGSQVDANGFLATTSDISNSDFMNGKNNFRSGGNANASIENNGTITIRNGGSAALVAPNVKNSGTINATGGKVSLAAGDTFAIDPYGDGLIQLAVPEHMARGMVENSGTINAAGGKVQLATSLDDVTDSLINLGGTINVDNGKVNLSGGVIDQTGKINAKNGSVKLSGNKISEQGAIVADNGSVDISFNKAYIDSSKAKITTSGTKPGSISIKGANKDSKLFASGTYQAKGTNAKGGSIKVTAGDIKLYAAAFNASGDTGGGLINIGGGFQGSSDLMHADTVAVNPYTDLIADALRSGKAGEVVVWSDIETNFGGNAYTRGKGYLANGGQIEISSKDKLNLSGVTDASAIFGKPGNVLLDPKNIIISTAGQSYPTYELIDPSFSAGNLFGQQSIVLTNGNVVVKSPLDDFSAADAGAVYMFNGTTGALISTFRGATANDILGENNAVLGLTSLVGNSNFVIFTSNFDNGAVVNAGAVTWASGSAGISGLVGVANSLAGSTTSDLGTANITTLNNGNYVVRSNNWDNGAFVNAGSVTWGNGLGGTTGVISAANSIVGSTTNDNVGFNPIIVLSNDNYVLRSNLWDNGAIVNAGAVTWASGLGGTVGAISAANSLVGSTAGDGIGVVIALTNGNYAVASSSWDNGGIVDAGAATWGNGLGGTVGVISAANSLVGTTASDGVGVAINSLSNGNYVVRADQWDNGAVVNAGAATWGNGLGGTIGAVSAANSLVGTTAADTVGAGGITTLNNGNYVVMTSTWDNGAVANAGAVTWGNGLGGTVGAVSIANSLVGTTASDAVGNAVTALTNGNYVVSSAAWDNGAVADAGATTWGNGLGGTVGAVSAVNSLVGTTASDGLGLNGVTALSNGNYVAKSVNWDNGAVVNAGAVTWGNGLGGTVGAITAANSLVGTSASDAVGSVVTALTNGNYVVGSSSWDNGAITNAGAVTWGNGLGGTVGGVSAANSVVGSVNFDLVSNSGITALTNGNYVVQSNNWDNGAVVNAGAFTWGNGTGGTVGAVTAANSLVGSTASDSSISNVIALSNGNYIVRSNSWDNGATVDAGAFTWGNGSVGTAGAVTPFNSVVGTAAGIFNAVENASNSTFIMGVTGAGRAYVASSNGPSALAFNSFAVNDVTISPAYLTNTLNTGASLTLQASNDITVTNNITVAAGGGGGALTLQAGRSILLNADIVTDNGNLNLYANSTAVDGVINAQRDAGAANITMGVGTSINAGTGNVVFQIKDGAGNTNRTSGNLTTRTINAGTFLADNTGTGDNIISGAITTTSAGNNLVMSTHGNINNTFGAGALNTGPGRFLLYGAAPATSTLNGITSAFVQFGSTYINNPPASITTPGNGLLWAFQPPTGGNNGGGSPPSVTPTTPPVTPPASGGSVTPVTPIDPAPTGGNNGGPSAPASNPIQALADARSTVFNTVVATNSNATNTVTKASESEDDASGGKDKEGRGRGITAGGMLCFYTTENRSDCMVQLGVGGTPGN